MQTPPSFNDQHAWGGQQFRVAQVLSPTIAAPQELSPPSARGGGDNRTSRLAQGGVISSSSDNLFHPPTVVPPSYAYNLPNVPLNPRFRAANHSPFSRPLPYPSTFTSYNNPGFVIPPPPPHNSSNHVPALPRAPSSGALPPIPLAPPPVSQAPPPVPQHFSSHPVYNVSYPPFIPQQPAYIHPAYDHPLPQHYTYPPSSFPSSPFSAIVSSSKTLPTVSHIPVLTSKNDFFPWDEGVQALIRANGLIGHILDPAAYVDPSRPDLIPTPSPILSMSASPQEIEASNRWWADDNIVQHILLSRLGSTPRGLLPSSTVSNRTALSIYQTLTQYYGTCNFADCTGVC